MRTYLVILAVLLVGCGKTACPIQPKVAADCTPEFRYGPACETQPYYSTHIVSDMVLVYEQSVCGNLLKKGSSK